MACAWGAAERRVGEGGKQEDGLGTEPGGEEVLKRFPLGEETGSTKKHG